MLSHLTAHAKAFAVDMALLVPRARTAMFVAAFALPLLGFSELASAGEPEAPELELGDLRVDHDPPETVEHDRDPPDMDVDKDFEAPDIDIDKDTRIKPDWDGGPVIRIEHDF